MSTCACGCGRPTSISKLNIPRLGHIKGQPVRYIHGHARKNKRFPVKATVKMYRAVNIGGRAVTLHRIRAEKALGKPLPPGAQVHHADGSRRDDAPLVICQDDAYHKLLHRRMKVKAAGGNPNTDRICTGCKVPRPSEGFWRSYCLACKRRKLKEWSTQSKKRLRAMRIANRMVVHA